MSALRWSIALAGLALGVVAYRMQIDNLGPFTSEARASAIVAVGWAFLLAGLVAWSRRPGNTFGPLMTAAALALLLRQLRYSHDSALFTGAFAVSELSYALVAHSVLAYPSGRVTDRYERSLVRVGYAATGLFPLAILLVYDGARPLRFFPRPRESLLLVSAHPHLADVLQQTFVVLVWGALAALFIALVVRRLVRATPRARRILAPLLLAAVAVSLRAVFESVFTFVDRPFASEYLFWWQIAGFVALPLALLAGFLRARLARATVADLVVALERTPPHDLASTLGRALGDRTLELGFWVPERRGFVDATGRPVELPSGTSARAVTHLEHDGQPIAVLVHDPSLHDEPRLVNAAAAAARLALENARLQAEMRAQLTQIRESRGRIVAAADEERRRIERNIHDGAQQRLVALALQLRTIQRQRVDASLDATLEEVVDGLLVAVEELRELARGVHPALLTEEGLAAALESLANRTPLRVSLAVCEGRLPPDVEAAAYFVACEGLANVVKHSHAAEARVTADRRDGLMLVAVEDDGVGGASVDSGSGLQGLADRVEALGGRLRVESPDSGGTRIVGEIPCVS